MIQHERKYTEEDIDRALEDLFAEQPFVTIGDVAQEVGCSSETARRRLNQRLANDELAARKPGARAKVYYLPELDKTAATSNKIRQEIRRQCDNDSQGTDSELGEEELTRSVARDNNENDRGEPRDEDVLFFPSRREIVIRSPSDRSQRILTQTAHLVDSNELGYMYKVDQVDIWNAPYDEFDKLCEDLKSVVGEDQWDGGFESRIEDDWSRAHQFRLLTHSEGYSVLKALDPEIFEDVAKRKLEHNTHYTKFLSDTELRVRTGGEAELKEYLYDEGYPVIDERLLEEGTALDIEFDNGIELRPYQQEWIENFTQHQAGVFTGPSGSGKTVAAIGVMSAISGETLIIVPSRELCQQWQAELISKTNLRRSQIGQYHGDLKQIRPVTIATYSTAAMSRHRELFNERDWGLVIADECHHSVASTWKRFREIQSKARLGLSATPVRESSDTKEIYTLIGPPVGTDWGRLFRQDWVAKPEVELIRVPWKSDRARKRYSRAAGNSKMIEAARNPKKMDVIRSLLEEHAHQKILIFVDWIRQGNEFAEALGLPFIYGETPYAEREETFQALRDGEISGLIVSRIGDEGIDLPDTEVAILASTMGSSRSQTGQRTGRTMRPVGESQVYILLTKGSGEEDWGRESTQYIAEKGAEITTREWEA